MENVKIFDFQDIESITFNLDNYRDITHYSKEINEYIIDCIASGKQRVTAENLEEKLANLESQVQSFTTVP